MKISQIEVIESREDVLNHINKVIKSRSEIFQTFHRKKSGEVFPVEVSVNFSEIEGGRIFAIIRDITEKRNSEYLFKLRHELSNMVHNKRGGKEILKFTIEFLERVTKSSCSFFHIYNNELKEFSLEVWSNQTLKNDNLYRELRDKNIWDIVLKEKRYIIKDDLLNSKFSRYIISPVTRNSKVVAIIGIINREYSFSQNDIKLIKDIAEEGYIFYERQIAEERIEYLAYYDPLTNLPKIELRNGNIVGFEALIRWNHPEKGLLTPNRFLPIVEGTPQELALGEWVVQHGIKQLESWHNSGKEFKLSINISPRQIEMIEFVQFLEKELKKYDKNIVKFLELEILEVAGIGDTRKVKTVMERCKKLGINFSLDDFGTGYSSLTHFHRLPIDILKIDQNFVKSMLDSESDLDIVEGVLRIAETLKRHVVAEGVESIELGLILLSLGCQYAQGFGIAKPMPIEEVSDWIEEWEESSFWKELPKYTSGLAENYDINVAIFSHQEWLKSVENYVVKRDKEPIFSGSRCQFMRWYQGVGQSRYSNVDGFKSLKELHEKVHFIGERVNILMKAGEQEKAKIKLEKLFKSGEFLIEALIELAKTSNLKKA